MTLPRYNPEFGKIVLTVSKKFIYVTNIVNFFKLIIEKNLPNINFSKLANLN